MFSPAQPTGGREQEFAPLLFSLTPADVNMTTPRSVTPHRTGADSSAQRRSLLNTSGSVHTEATPQAPPPPVSRLVDDVTMEDASASGRQRAQPPPPVFSLATWGDAPGGAQQQPQQGAAPLYEDVWVTIFGFTQQDVPLILKEFARCGDILQWGTYGAPQSNYIHVQFQNKYAAQRALLRDGEQLTSSLVVGVKPVDARHRAAIEQYDVANDVDTLKIQRPAVHTDRPYRLQQSSVTQQVPQPARSFAAKIAEFVFGF